MATSTVEDYLKRLWLLGGGRASVSTGRLAEAAGVAPGTATAMAQTLAHDGLAQYEPYLGVRLSAKGRDVALATLRRHRLVELFLVRVLGMDWAEVHEDAERLEHAISDRLLERIDALLGRPAVDPHGDPIPSPQGRVARPEYTRLAGATRGVRWKVARVVDQSPEFLRAMAEHGLKPDVTVEVRERDAGTGTLTVRRGRRKIVLAKAAAEKILVRPAQ